jgi:hypothetical protein
MAELASRRGGASDAEDAAAGKGGESGSAWRVLAQLGQAPSIPR